MMGLVRDDLKDLEERRHHRNNHARDFHLHKAWHMPRAATKRASIGLFNDNNLYLAVISCHGLWRLGRLVSDLPYAGQ